MILSLIAIAATLAAAPVTARSPIVARTVVAHADLDLSTRDGRAHLDRRIARAAREVCGPWSALDLAGKVKALRCRRATIAGVAEQRNALATGQRIEVATGR